MSVDKKLSLRLKEWFSFFNQSAISLPVVVFGVLAVSVLTASTVFQDNLQRTTTQTTNQLIQEGHLKTVVRLDAYSLIARSGIGLTRMGEVTNEGWNVYLESMELDEDYPSIEAMVYAQATAPVTEPDSSFSIKYVYPETERTRPSLGRELTAADNTNWQTIVEAVKSGQTKMTDAQKITGQDGKPHYYFLLYTPVYDTLTIPETEAERLKHIKGAILVVSNAERLFNIVYKNQDTSLANMTISQDLGSERVALYRYGDHPGGHDRRDEQRTLDIMGQKLIYDYEFSERSIIPATQRFVALGIPLIGLTLSLLLAIIISFTLRSRNQRLSIAREREVQAAKDELLSLASHQLRTPATGVKQYLGMVIQGFAGEVSDTQRDFLDRAYASNERQLHIINDILYLAKLDAGRIVLTKTKFDLAEMVREVGDELQESAREAELTLTVQAPKKAAVYADSHMLRMIVENLTTNAIKYTNPGGEIKLRLVRTGDQYSVHVKDSGVGIGSEDVERLFIQFSRIPNERSNQVSGTGVGLYLARSLARMHGGDVTVKSKLGEGSTFTITIPRGL